MELELDRTLPSAMTCLDAATMDTDRDARGKALVPETPIQKASSSESGR
jgi:hypothetical protein